MDDATMLDVGSGHSGDDRPLDVTAFLHDLALDRQTSHADTDARALLPLLTRLHERRLPASRHGDARLGRALRADDPVVAEELCAYPHAIASLSPRGLAADTADESSARPLYRRFEDASPAGRARLVLQHILGDADPTLGNPNTRDATLKSVADDELFRQDIYRPHVVAIVVNALAADALAPSLPIPPPRALLPARVAWCGAARRRHPQ
ncbi:hypothetical protein PINS_up011596 [Pythium insidiosum]|nr:hypothetical protein PINS_up011596 [Pythium insidiosum]